MNTAPQPLWGAFESLVPLWTEPHEVHANRSNFGDLRADLVTRLLRPASRAAVRSADNTRPAILKAVRAKAKPVARTVKAKTVKRAEKSTARVVKSNKATSRAPQARTGMSAVVAFALAQVGEPYRFGASGPNTWDCSSLTAAAYRQIGKRLPHSSREQAAMARTVSSSDARPGDLIVGPGHVGIFLGGGMMVDAGNPRVGVVRRKMYAGLHIERF